MVKYDLGKYTQLVCDEVVILSTGVHEELAIRKEIDCWIISTNASSNPANGSGFHILNQRPISQEEYDRLRTLGAVINLARLRINRQEARRKFELAKEQRPKCPKCRNNMEIRKSASGQFWGCSTYRASGCRGTRQIERS